MPVKDWWDKAYVVFTGLLVIAGGLGVFFAIRTLHGIESQAKSPKDTLAEIKAGRVQTDKLIGHAEKQAGAALSSATTVINAERAWVDVGFAVQGGGKYDFLITNHGKSPAFITRCILGRGYWDEGVKEIPIGHPGHYVDKLTIHNILPPNAQPQNVLSFDVAHYPSGEDGQTVTYHGHATYGDIFGQEHRTEVVYSLERSTGRLRSLHRYTRYVTITKDGEEAN